MNRYVGFIVTDGTGVYTVSIDAESEQDAEEVIKLIYHPTEPALIYEAEQFREAVEDLLSEEADFIAEVEPEPKRKLTRQERLEGLADSGVDTWEDYRGEK
jgi:hypothetical protein